MLTSRDQVTWKYVQNESFPVTRVVTPILTDVDNYLIFREKNRNTYMRTYRPLLRLVRILLSLETGNWSKLYMIINFNFKENR